MAISNATRLSDFGSGIGTQGAIIQVDNANQRVGIGTTNPEYTLDVKGTLNATTLGLTNFNVTGLGTIRTGVSSNFNVTGILTSQDIKVAAAITALTGRFGLAEGGGTNPSVTINASGINLTQGIVTATSFEGDGSTLTGVSGFGSAFDNTSGTLGNQIYETPRTFYQTGVTSAYINAEASSGNIAFTRLDEIRLGVGATLHIGAGTTLIMNVLNLF